MTQITKKQLIAKIAKEQNVNPKSLERMNIEALKKMDAVVADEDDLLGSSEEASSSSEAQPSSDENTSDTSGTVVASEDGITIVTPPESPSKESTVSEEDASKLPTESDSSTTPSCRVVIGFHPVTEQPVYLDAQ